MKTLACVSVALVLASLPATAFAQVTQTYSYDGNGRLIGVSTTGSGGTNTAAYAYDDADNRTSRSQTGTSAYAALLRLPAHEVLRPDQAIVSPGGLYSLALRSPGQVEIWPVEGQSPVEVRSVSGLFEVNASGAVRLAEEQGRRSTAGAHLTLTDFGDMLVLAEDGTTVLWRSDNCCR